MAGTISDLARLTLRRDFRAINPAAARVVIVEGQTRVLPTFPEKLSRKAGEALAGMGVEVWFDCHVTGVGPDHVTVTSDKDKAVRRIDTETIVWAAGVKASPLGKKLAGRLGPGVEADRAGRIAVAPDCSVPGHPHVFVIGDMAAMNGPDGKPLPGVAPVAMQQGDYVAGVIARRVKGESPPAGFRYWDKGTMATIGRARAVAEAFGLQMSGYLAWLAWLFIHILYLARFENRVLVVFQWVFNYVTRNRAARLITGTHAADEYTLGPKPGPPPEPVARSAAGAAGPS
jgi:NADH dehydrogenase